MANVEIGPQYDATIKVKQVTNIDDLQDGELYYQTDEETNVPHLFVKFGEDGIQLAEQDIVNTKADEGQTNDKLNQKVNINDLKTLDGQSLISSGNQDTELKWPPATLSSVGGIKAGGQNVEILPDGTLNVKLTPTSLDDMCSDGTNVYDFTYRQLFETDKSNNGYNCSNSKIDDTFSTGYLSSPPSPSIITTAQYYTKNYCSKIVPPYSAGAQVATLGYSNKIFIPHHPTEETTDASEETVDTRIFWFACKTKLLEGRSTDFLFRLYLDPTSLQKYANISFNELKRLQWETHYGFIPGSLYKDTPVGGAYLNGAYTRFQYDKNSYEGKVLLDNIIINIIPQSLVEKLWTREDSFWTEYEPSDERYTPHKKEQDKIQKAMKKLYENYLTIKITETNNFISIYGNRNLQDLKDGVYYWQNQYGNQINVGKIHNDIDLILCGGTFQLNKMDWEDYDSGTQITDAYVWTYTGITKIVDNEEETLYYETNLYGVSKLVEGVLKVKFLRRPQLSSSLISTYPQEATQ